jgi:hypothetical protein
VGGERLTRSGPTVESIHGHDPDDVEYAIEVSYEGVYELDERALDDGSALDADFNTLGGWIASLLVKLGDLDLVYRPPLDD